MRFALLTPLLNIFMVTFQQGGVRLQPDALWLLAGFFGLELTRSGMWFVLRHELEWVDLVYKTLTAAILLYAIQHWPALTMMVARGFASAGTKAGGDTVGLVNVF